MAKHYNTLKIGQFALSISLLSTIPFLRADWFDMDDLFNGMEQHMLQIRQEMDKIQQSMHATFTRHCAQNDKKSLKVQLNQDQAGKGIILTVSNLETDTVDAHIDDQTGILRIATPQATIKIATRNTMIAIDIDEKREQENSEQKDGNNRNYFCSHSQAYIKKPLTKPLNLESTKIDYNAESHELIVAIEYMDDAKQHGKKLPVTFTKSPPNHEPAPIK